MAVSVAAAAPADYILRQNSAAPGSPAILAPSPAAPAVVPELAGPEPATPALPGADGKKIRIGLLLPLASPLLGEAADIVRQGVAAALQVDARADVGVIEQGFADEAAAPQAYRDLLARGANVVIGPMTRGTISRITPQVQTVPTLALNTLDGSVRPARLFGLSLSVEAEAAQIAGLMGDEGMRSPLLIADGSPLSQRLVQAFSRQWQLRHGLAPQVLDSAAASGAVLENALTATDAVFLALPGAEAAQVRAVLPAERPVYATSQVHVRETLPTLAGVRFVDMPWLLMPDHPAVKMYPRPANALTMPTERLYALGIDAYRLAVRLAEQKSPAGLRLNGVSGDLRLLRDQQFQRSLPVWVMNASGPQ